MKVENKLKKLADKEEWIRGGVYYEKS